MELTILFSLMSLSCITIIVYYFFKDSPKDVFVKGEEKSTYIVKDNKWVNHSISIEQLNYNCTGFSSTSYCNESNVNQPNQDNSYMEMLSTFTSEDN